MASHIMETMDDVEKFIKIIKESDNIVFFGGAGVSTESGIPDFRGTGGLYHEQYDYPPETILSAGFFWNYPKEFFRFYKDKMLFTSARPNLTHFALARLEQAGKLKAVITQNIDNLHEQAGSKAVYHLHGTIHSNTCTSCQKKYGISAIEEADGLPVCSCGGLIKPDVVLYGEQLPEREVEKSIEAIERADVLIVGGTSLTVYPAAAYVEYFKGKHLILINKDATVLDKKAELVFHEKLGDVFKDLLDEQGNLR